MVQLATRQTQTFASTLERLMILWFRHWRPSTVHLHLLTKAQLRRKEIIAKFLDLEVFEKKFRMAKEDSVEAKVMLKKASKIKTMMKRLMGRTKYLKIVVDSVKANKYFCTELRGELTALLQDSLGALEAQISAIPNELIDIAKLREEHKGKTKKAATLMQQIKEQSIKRD